MRNYAPLVIDLLNGEKYLTIVRLQQAEPDEQRIRFELKDEDTLDSKAILEVKNEETGKTERKKSIPLDFDDITGLPELLRLIAAFVYPSEEVEFNIYKKHGRKRIQNFVLPAV